MKPIYPKHLAHIGIVKASGYYFSTDLLSESEIKRRLIIHWQPNDKIFKIETGYIWRWQQTKFINTQQALGITLTEYQSNLLSFPLSPAQLKQLPYSQNKIWLLQHGTIQAFELNDLIDISQWLDLSQLTIETLTPLASKQAMVKTVKQAIPDLPENQRSLFSKKIPPASDTTQTMLAELHQKASATTNSSPSFWQRWFGKPPTQTNNIPHQPKQRPTPKQPSLFHQLFNKSSIPKWIGRRYARFLRQLLQQFDEGDMDSALRNAIPLSRLSQHDNTALPSFQLPTARNNFNLNLQPNQMSGGSINLSDAFYDQLKKLYRRSFEKLDQQGDIEKAAFVLLELLDAPQEAIDYLEKHKQYTLAAQIAESRQLHAAAIRLWLMAGEKQRAINLGRLSGAYSEAITQLHIRHPEQAKILRLLWANELADMGDFGHAIDAIWPITEAHHIALSWIDASLEREDSQMASLLIKKLVLDENHYADTKAHIISLFNATDPHQNTNQIQLIEHLLAAESTPEVRTIARIAIRYILQQSPSHHKQLVQYRHYLRDLCTLAQDTALCTDLPPLQTTTAEALSTTAQPLEYHWSAMDTGQSIIYDAVPLGNQLLVALGELGIQLLNAQGKVIVHFNHPAQHLVISEQAQHAIAIAEREDRKRLTKIDLVNRKATHWCDAVISCYSKTYSGAIWFVAEQQRIMAIDTLHTDWVSLWHINELGHDVNQISRSKIHCCFMTHHETWLIRLNDMALVQREVVEITRITPATEFRYIALNSTSEPLVCQEDENNNTALYRFTSAQHFSHHTLPGKMIAPPLFDQDWLIAITQDEQITYVKICDRSRLILRAILAFESLPQAPNLTLIDGYLTLSDHCGRLIVIELDSGQIIQDLRLLLSA